MALMEMHKISILVVNGAGEISDMLRETLTDQSLSAPTIYVTNDEQESFDLLSTKEISLIIIDVSFPWAEKLLAWRKEQSAKTKIMLVIGEHSKPQSELFNEADEIIVKPYDTVFMLRKVKGLMNCACACSL